MGYPGPIDLGSVGMGSADAAALAALEIQARRLDAVAGRLSAAVDRHGADALDTSPTAEWYGPARASYDLAAGRLRSLLAAALGEVDEALSETRRAIGTVGGRG